MSNYRCPRCTRKLEPHGTGGMTCSEGHHFLVPDIRAKEPRLIGKRRVPIHPWLPGAVLGGLALIVEGVRLLD